MFFLLLLHIYITSSNNNNICSLTIVRYHQIVVVVVSFSFEWQLLALYCLRCSWYWRSNNRPCLDWDVPISIHAGRDSLPCRLWTGPAFVWMWWCCYYAGAFGDCAVNSKPPLSICCCYVWYVFCCLLLLLPPSLLLLSSTVHNPLLETVVGGIVCGNCIVVTLFIDVRLRQLTL